jgi:effector-binding domain-containing protein
MVYEVSLRDMPDQRIISVRGRVVRPALPVFIIRSLDDVRHHLRLLGVGAIAGPFVIYHRFGPNLVDAEVCVPVAGDILAVGRFATRLLPGATVARTVHVGPYEELGAAYAALIRWIGPRGFDAAGPVRERYVEGPGGEALPADYRTVIDLPVARAAVPAH